jgi:hypothetical protein
MRSFRLRADGAEAELLGQRAGSCRELAQPRSASTAVRPKKVEASLKVRTLVSKAFLFLS